MSRLVAIIGDRFMLCSALEERVGRVCRDYPLVFRTMEQPWPDEPMHHGYHLSGLDDLKEYMGDPDEISDFIGDAEIAIVHLAPFSRGMFERLSKLRLIAVTRGGPVSIDMVAARDHGVLVVNTPGRNAGAVAEFTVGAILAETRLIRVGHEALRGGLWRGDLYRADRTGRELSELAVGIIGYGHVGRLVVKLLRPFGCRIVVCDPYMSLTAEDQAAGVVGVGLDDLLASCDVVSIHSRVTPATSPLFDAARFAQMKDGALLINTSRGPIVDYDALYEALTTGRLGGAMLDTFAVEPPDPDLPLLRLPNVTVTPHIAGASRRTITTAVEQVAEEVRRFLAGESPVNPC